MNVTLNMLEVGTPAGAMGGLKFSVDQDGEGNLGAASHRWTIRS
ncbi:hypothetical protein CLOSTMETH_01055 [[Clostridium] methylpentosum DSM 5476]|uniref:Uncharacterized protein n=1 Tax=[Clostridium] methylpentosum DSM 5476 TaxID=537013 RepID=C0EB38_9FIRM|nr:hypothetical protein CLOSTMETH_01055 [[Clostridium] methylpentosum DSM 5476]